MHTSIVSRKTSALWCDLTSKGSFFGREINPLISGKSRLVKYYPQTGTFADPETHPLRAFVPFLPHAVLALGPLFFAFLNASLASVHT